MLELQKLEFEQSKMNTFYRLMNQSPAVISRELPSPGRRIRKLGSIRKQLGKCATSNMKSVAAKSTEKTVFCLESYRKSTNARTSISKKGWLDMNHVPS